ncbi:MAG: DUF72 domain-containing protein [Alphaproteobacteria bacterium]|nr:DUF72 domain-containing protein [Alphaproteobacteria bacterium]
MRWIGTAGWAIRREHKALFPGEGPHLARYAARLNAVEINSSFYRPHRPSTYARWRDETPDAFRFSVKMPRAITHEARLTDAGAALGELLAQCGALREKLGCILIQLPRCLAFGPGDFFERLRDQYRGPAALEPRHGSWFAPEADEMLKRHRIARVAADPAIGPFAPGGYTGFEYWRLHGSPRIYYGEYDDVFLRALSARIGADAWTIFDNTALGHATRNALALKRRAGLPTSRDPRPAPAATSRAARRPAR